MLNCGGNWNNGANAGLWNWNGNNTASDADSSIGGRICCKRNKNRVYNSQTTRSEIAVKSVV
nr:MAG TPA: hypothetical protein [Bacteriophage sp.]